MKTLSSLLFDYLFLRSREAGTQLAPAIRKSWIIGRNAFKLADVPTPHSDSDESLLAVPHTGSADEQHRKPADRTADEQPLTIRHPARQRQRRHCDVVLVKATGCVLTLCDSGTVLPLSSSTLVTDVTAEPHLPAAFLLTVTTTLYFACE